MKRLILLSILSALFVSEVPAKPPVLVPPDVPVLGPADLLLYEKLYLADDPDASLQNLQQDEEFQRFVDQHDLQLFSGPMLGCLTPTSAKVWVRTARPAKVQVVFAEDPSLASPKRTAAITTDADGDYTAVLSLEGLKPFTEYHYDVLVDGRSGLPEGFRPRFRSNPERGDAVSFSIGFGGGARYIHEKERIWDTIASTQPHAFLFLGDNIYIDEPEWRGKQRAMYYRRQLRPEFRRLTSSCGTYAIWDDHDFGVNDSAGGPQRYQPDWKLPAWKVFSENWVNPAYGGGEQLPGCWFSFSIGDVDFFMTDGRYYRSFPDGTMLGPEQKQWLLDELKSSTATFKVIASGTLWTEHADKGGADSWWGVPEEREEIFSLIDEQQIGGVILLSADRHRNDIYRIKRPNSYDLYEFETSKLTNDHTHPTKSEAIFSYNEGNFYGAIDFDLTLGDPTVTARCVGIDGNLIHSFPLKRSQLEPSK